MKYYPPRYLFRRFEILRLVQPGKLFLEIGPGNLYLSTELLRFFEQGTLVEFNEAANFVYAQLSDDVKARLSLIITDFLNWDASQQFDCVVACEVLEHVVEDGRFLQKISHFLKPSGQLILSIPSRMKLWSIHDEIVGHIRRYERNELINLLNENGYKQVKISSYGFPFVNLLRIPRIMLAKKQAEQKQKWNQEQQTKESGFVKGGILIKLIGILLNPFTIFPLALISVLFNRTDWSGGYVVTARYVGKIEH